MQVSTHSHRGHWTYLFPKIGVLAEMFFSRKKDGECKVPTRYVMITTSPQKLSISAKWYNLVIEGADPLQYLVLLETDMNSVEDYIESNTQFS